MTGRQRGALAPLSHASAQVIHRRLSRRSQLNAEQRLLYGRSLRTLQSFQAAWNELTALRRLTRDPLLRARAEIDLISVAYFLNRPGKVAAYLENTERSLAGQPLMLAELCVVESALATREDRIADAYREVEFAKDALAAVPPGRGKEIVNEMFHRQRAHLLAQSACYEQATEAAEACASSAARIASDWESARATYTRGFVAWLCGRLEEARGFFEQAEAGLRATASSTWRWTLCCLATVEAELGQPERAQRVAQQTGYATPATLAYLSLRAGEPAAAEKMLTHDSGSEEPDPETRAVSGLIRCHLRDERAGVRELEEAGHSFSSRGLAHYAYGCAIHAAFWRARAGLSQAETVHHVLESILKSGGEGFAWYDAEVALWLALHARKRGLAHPNVKRMVDRAKTILALSEEVQDLSELEATPAQLKARGLTEREVETVQAIRRRAGAGRHDRAGLAAELGVTENTLRIHIGRIRDKLEVGRRRGDAAILEAASDLERLSARR
jgi:hypothetical protein